MKRVLHVSGLLGLVVLGLYLFSMPSQNRQLIPFRIEHQDTGSNHHASFSPSGNIGSIPVPNGYRRISGKDPEFAEFLRSIALMEDNTVYLYNGHRKSNQRAQFAVLDVSVGERDLQQCADAVIRLRAEYLWKMNRKDEIAFHFTSGHLASWNKYSQGYRPVIKGNNVTWNRSAPADSSRKAFAQYLDMVFTYCGTRSLHKELQPVKDQLLIEPGDVFIQTGDPYGHAVLVVDVAESGNGDRVFMLAQSYMPAQDIHILRNPTSRSDTPWFHAKKTGKLITPEWMFDYQDLRQFE